MFNNPGKKVKLLARILFVLLSILPVLGGIVIMMIDTSTFGIDLGGLQVIIGLLVIIFGIIFAWLSSILLYTLGAMADDLEIIHRATVRIYHELEDMQKNKANTYTVSNDSRSFHHIPD